MLVLQVGYGVPAVLVALIALKPHVTGRELISSVKVVISCLFRTDSSKIVMKDPPVLKVSFPFLPKLSKLLTSIDVSSC